MKKMFKLKSIGTVGFDGVMYFDTFEEAKTALRQTILSPEGITHITDKVMAYAREQYPDNTPVAFEQLVSILKKLVTDPDYPQLPSDVVLEEFADDNIEFYLDAHSRIFIYVFNDDFDQKFPTAEIVVIKMYDPEKVYYFYLKDKMWDPEWCWNVKINLNNEEK